MDVLKRDLTKRNLSEDLRICSAVRPREEWINEGVYVEEYDHLTEMGCDLIATFERDSDAEFSAEARSGWPEAVRRAIAAEAEVEILRKYASLLRCCVRSGERLPDDYDIETFKEALEP